VQWDARKNAENIRQRNLSFARVEELIDVHVALDTRKPYGEVRYIVTGWLDGRLHIAIVTLRGDDLRVISFRRANRREEHRYVQARRQS
jgi:uncharacterized DUF497 family protein